jgi:hypothetical protein
MLDQEYFSKSTQFSCLSVDAMRYLFCITKTTYAPLPNTQSEEKSSRVTDRLVVEVKS